MMLKITLHPVSEKATKRRRVQDDTVGDDLTEAQGYYISTDTLREMHPTGTTKQ